MNPASPVGYCRVVKIIRLLVSKRSEPEVARSLAVIVRDARLSSATRFADLVKPFIRCGIHNTKTYGKGLVTKYHMVLHRMAHSLGMAEAKRDPMRTLPRELISLVFSFLDLTSLCRCKRVSKEWARILISDKAAWAHVHMTRPRNPGRYFEKFLRYRPGIRNLIMEDVQDFGLTTARVGTLCALQDLRRLHLGIAKKGYAFPPPEPNKILGLQLPRRLCALTHLSLRITEARNFVIPELMTSFRETLEDIDVVSGSVRHLATFDANNPFPRLKRLRLFHTGDGFPKIQMENLVSACPQLEELCINGFTVENDLPSALNPAQPGEHTRWLNLRRLIFGPLTKHHRFLSVRCPVGHLLPTLSSLEHLELLGQDPCHASDCRFVADEDGPVNVYIDEEPSEHSPFPILKTFRCRTTTEPKLLQHVISEAAEKGVLETLELSIGASLEGLHMSTQHRENRQPRPAEAYSFTVCDGVKSLGLYDFNWAPAGHYSAFDGEPFLTWLAMFKSVETVAFYPGAYSGVASMVIRIMKEFPSVKVIYQDRLEGADWDHARTLGKKYGVEVKHVKGYAPTAYSGYEAW
ncbi:hypothetical protein OQA88_11442 [Cercophora sp. LCS_1]